MSRSIKWVAMAAAMCFAVGTVIYLFSQELEAKGASASSRLSSAPASSAAVAKCVKPALPNERVQYGRIKSLTRKGRSYEMRFDPAFWLSGVTARRASLEDHPGDPGGDYYILDEGHRLVTYLVPATARVTIVTRLPRSERATVSELAQLVKGKNPKHRRWLNMHYGFSIRLCQGAGLAVDTVRSLDQVYRP